MRCGITEVTVSPARPGGPYGGRAAAKISPVTLKASASVRLRRLFPDALLKGGPHSQGSHGEGGVLVLPIPRNTKDHTGFVSEALAELYPED